MKKDNLFIVMPAYNEEQNIEQVVRQWYEKIEDKGDSSKLIIAASGSTDNTNYILNKLKESLPKLEILGNTDREHGPKVFALYDYAVKNNIDYIFQTDSDGQTNPEEFDDFWKIRNEYNAIFGCRKVRKDGTTRIFVEKIVCFLLFLYFGIFIPDANAPFRLMRTSVLKKYLYKINPKYILPNIIITTFFCYYREKVAFKDISFKKRKYGINSIDIFKIIKIGVRSLKDFYIFKRNIKMEN